MTLEYLQDFGNGTSLGRATRAEFLRPLAFCHGSWGVGEETTVPKKHQEGLSPPLSWLLPWSSVGGGEPGSNTYFPT